MVYMIYISMIQNIYMMFSKQADVKMKGILEEICTEN